MTASGRLGRLCTAVAACAVIGLCCAGSAGAYLGSGQLQFAKSGVGVGSGPARIVTADFNRDGIPDLAVTNENDNTVSILIGSGSGSFSQPNPAITVGTAPVGVAVGDFDGDGNPDLAVANNGSSTVSILIGTGSGTFTQPNPAISIGDDPFAIVVADFNGDGNADLATIDFDATSKVSILIGSGSGTFTQPNPAIDVAGPSAYSRDLAVGDFNGDGNPDLAVGGGGADTVVILIGSGSGTFSEPNPPVPAGPDPIGVAVADFNGDGIPDIATANYLTDGRTVSFLLGSGSGTFSEPTPPVDVGSGPFDLVTGDFDGDGTPDIATAKIAGSSISVLRNISVPGVAAAGSLTFPAGDPGSVSPSQTVTVYNNGAAPLHLTGAVLVGQDANAFTVSGDACSGQTVAVGASCTIGVQFSPKATGPATAQLRIVSNVPGGANSVALSGSGGVPGVSFGVTPGSVFSTGLNANGQLGSGGALARSSLGPLQSGAPQNFVAVSSGSTFSVGLTAAGRVFAWGQNASGQLGNGSTVEAHAPVAVGTPSAITAVSAGIGHALALRSDGTVWAWGNNAHGQLGNGSYVNSSVPVQVSGLSNVVAIAAGGYQNYALLSDGTVWGWGYGLYGELGNGTATTTTVPVKVSGLTGVTAIAAGEYHGLALESDGTLRAWGYNSQGQLGNNTTTNATTPITVSGISTAVAIAAGADHSLAVLQGGSVKAWGYNAKGQVGNGGTTSAKTPVAVGGLPAITQVSAGANHSLAIAANGTVWAWGANPSGQLGNGSTAASVLTPVQMGSAGHGGAVLGSGSEGNHSLVIGQPYATLAPAAGSTISFTAPGVGQSSTSLTETVTDTGLEPLSFGQASITGADGDEFVITGDGCSNVTIAVGASCVIGLRFNEKVNETNPVATLRVPSNSPTGPDMVKLDPPPAQASTDVGPGTATSSAPATAGQPGPAATTTPTRGATVEAGLICAHSRLAHRTLTVSCTLTHAAAGQKVVARLARGGRTIARANARSRGTRVTLRLRLPRAVSRGRYTLTVSLAGSTSRLTFRVRR